MQAPMRHSRGGVSAADGAQDRPPLSGVGEMGAPGGLGGGDVVPRPLSPRAKTRPAPWPPGVIITSDGPPLNPWR
jgi:hypothetical protein